MSAIKVIRSGQWTDASRPSFEIEGKDWGAPLTLLLEDLSPGRGPRLHSHPYDELWVCQAGTAEFTDGDEAIAVGPGDIVFAPAGAAHKFISTGDAPLRMVCIHCWTKFSTEWLEPDPRT